jgi:endonuclease YncB( thermonuclease family)
MPKIALFKRGRSIEPTIGRISGDGQRVEGPRGPDKKWYQKSNPNHRGNSIGFSASCLWALAITLTGGLIAGCTPAPSPSYISAETATLKVSMTAQYTSTQIASTMPTPTTTLTPTTTITPSITPTATEDISFYNVADCIPIDTIYERGTVTKIVDGDTIEVQLGDGITNTVRYIGIDAPEDGFPFFEEAKSANAELVFQNEVVLVRDQSETDPYQRRLRYVIVGSVFVNQELVTRGFARAENYPPDEACKEAFISAEQEAQLTMTGMWIPTPSPEPWAGQVVILTVNKREEWVEIQNIGSFDVDLADWKLVSERGHQDCPLTGILKAGEVLRIWAMEAQGEGYSCGYHSPIWNNAEADPAVLYNAQGVEVSRK